MKLTAMVTFCTLCIAAGIGHAADEAKVHYEIRTDLGTITIAADPTAAPETCKAFKQYVKDKVYKKSFFHRVTDDLIMGGKPGDRAKGYSSSGNFSYKKAPPGEFSLSHKRGAIVMARTVGSCNPDKCSNSTQFTIYRKDSPADDGEFTVFGYVTEGMDVVEAIAASLETSTDDDEATPVEMTVKKKRG